MCYLGPASFCLLFTYLWRSLEEALPRITPFAEPTFQPSLAELTCVLLPFSNISLRTQVIGSAMLVGRAQRKGGILWAVLSVFFICNRMKTKRTWPTITSIAELTGGLNKTFLLTVSFKEEETVRKRKVLVEPPLASSPDRQEERRQETRWSHQTLILESHACWWLLSSFLSLSSSCARGSNIDDAGMLYEIGLPSLFSQVSSFPRAREKEKTGG